VSTQRSPRSSRIIFYVLVGMSLAASASAEGDQRRPVLVELFTSEGCSSCPPADVLLQKLVAQQPIAGAEIIAFEEHVDYWNHDGWIDPFSSAEWTQRQQDYVQWTNGQPYTPELVVDGRGQFNGSDGPKAVSEIDKASRDAKTQITITPAAAKNSRKIAVSVGAIPEEGNNKDVAEVWLAITEDGLHSQADAGENKGRTLNHVATLRSLRKIGIAKIGTVETGTVETGTANPEGSVSFSGSAELKINSHWAPANLRVTVFVQRKKSRAILGAASAKLAQREGLSGGSKF